MNMTQFLQRLGADVSELRSLKYVLVPQKLLQEQTSVMFRVGSDSSENAIFLCLF